MFTKERDRSEESQDQYVEKEQQQQRDIRNSGSSNSSYESDNENNKHQRIRRTDSVVAYRTKQIINIRNSIDETNHINASEVNSTISNVIHEESSDSSSENQDYEYSDEQQQSKNASPQKSHHQQNESNTTSATLTINTSDLTTTTTTSAITTTSTTTTNILSVSQNPYPTITTNRRDSVDSNDPNFGYEDQPLYKTVMSPAPNNLKPINSPIPNRPVFKVDASPENELINHSLIALRTSVLQGNDEKVAVTQDQFELIKKYKISMAEKRTTIKDFAPNVFKDLRSRVKIDSTTFLKSWSSYISSNDSSSKNNANNFTIYSSDRKYILKTITKAESIKLRKILPHYYDYLVYNSNSMLLKYLGLFRVEKRLNQNFYIVLLLNVFNTCCNVDQVISTKSIGESIKNKSNKKIQLDLSLKNAIYKQIEKDTTFLSSHDLIDYNMVIGVNKIDSKNEQDPSTIESETELSSSIQSQPPQQHEGLSSSTSSTPTSSAFTPPFTASPLELNSSVDQSLPATTTTSTSMTPTIIDPIKTVPRLLFFLEDVECVAKSNNFTISKSLKKSFATLPRSWTSENVDDSMLGGSPTITLTQSFVLPPSPTMNGEPASPPTLFNSLPSVLPLSKRVSLQNGNGNSKSEQTSPSLTPLSSSSNSISQPQQRCKNGFISENNNEIYYVCILDLLVNAEAANKKAPVKLMSKVRPSSPNSSNTFLKKFLSNAKSLLFLDNSFSINK